jgi:chromosome segregation ATPase
MSSVTVIEAEAVLAKATRQAAQERRENAKQKIQELRREGAEVRKQFRPLAAQVKQAQADRLRLHALLVQAREQIAVYARPLDPLDFPSDVDIQEHARQLEAWRARQAELLVQSADARDRESLRPHTVALAKRMDQIRFEISNWSAVASGLRPGEAVGGVYQGVEDFIGSMPITNL